MAPPVVPARGLLGLASPGATLPLSAEPTGAVSALPGGVLVMLLPPSGPISSMLVVAAPELLLPPCPPPLHPLMASASADKQAGAKILRIIIFLYLPDWSALVSVGGARGGSWLLLGRLGRTAP